MSQIQAWKAKAVRAQERAETWKEKGEAVLGHVIQTVEVCLMTFGFGLSQGRYGATDVLGVPIELGSGVVMHLLGFFNVFGKHADHAHNIGDGALGAYFHTLGVGIGDQWRTEAAATAPTTAGGYGHQLGMGASADPSLGQGNPTSAAATMADLQRIVESAQR
jgi:hypothetical protein